MVTEVLLALDDRVAAKSHLTQVLAPARLLSLAVLEDLALVLAAQVSVPAMAVAMAPARRSTKTSPATVLWESCAPWLSTISATCKLRYATSSLQMTTICNLLIDASGIVLVSWLLLLLLLLLL